jgi:hypothetical protein
VTPVPPKSGGDAMTVAALNLTIGPGPGDTVRLAQGDNETLLSREAWDRIVAAVEDRPESAVEIAQRTGHSYLDSLERSEGDL